MSVFLQPIYTQTIAGGNTGSITFNNIPQTFTDLKLEISGRENTVTGYTFIALYVRYNNDSSSLYSDTRLYGNGSSASSSRINGTAQYLGSDGAANSTANTFNSISAYIPNYTGSNYKQVITDSVAENNASGVDMFMNAGLYRSTSAITSIQILPQITFSGYTTVSLYGVLRQGI